jgi:membrane associated rhomboid family serine protease
MGIYDRDYLRDQTPSAGVGGVARRMSMWSANTWLIVACVAVFVVDGFLPARWVPMRTQPLVETQQPIDKSALEGGAVHVQVADPRTGEAVVVAQDLLLGGQPVARQWFQRMQPLESYLHFSSQRGFFDIGFWRLIGFQFLHASFAHLLFNMIGLYFFGPMVERYLGSKRYLAFYLLCGICGALMYALLNVAGAAGMLFGLTKPIPGLLFNDLYTPLVGASAGVFGVIMAGAFLAPNATVLLFFVLPMKLRTVAYGLVVIALYTLITGGQNAGGEAGHLGGALAGFYFIRHPRHLHGFFDVLGRIDPTSHHYRHGKGPAGPRAGPRVSGRAAAPSREEVDRILDKVHESGLSSLTDREKRILREASER